MKFCPSRSTFVLLATATAFLLFPATGCQQAKNELAELPPAEVTVTHPIQQPVTQFVEENGTIEAAEEAEVRARVRGFIEELVFKPGQVVKAGDVLYRIEPDQYEAEKNSAEATLAAATAAIQVAQAQVRTAEADLVKLDREYRREGELIKSNATSQASYETAEAALASAKANLSSTQASVEAAKSDERQAAAKLAQAQLDLDYTIVRAPISGRITKTDIKLGNLVENGTVLSTIVDDRRVFVNFNLSDREVLRYRKVSEAKLSAGEEFKEPELSSIPVYLRRELDQGFPFEGRLDYVDQEGIDSRTGTLALRAVFENPDDSLFPGLFVRVRMPSEQVPAVLIPELAVGKDQRGSYALTVGQENKVSRASIVTGAKYSGWIVVDSGLSVDDRVIYEGIQRSRPGIVVKPDEKNMTISDEELLRGMPARKPADAESAADETATDEAATDADAPPPDDSVTTE